MSASHPSTGSRIPAHVRIGLGTLACLCLLAGSSFLREAPLSAAPAKPVSSAVQQADAIQDFIRFERMSGPKAELQTSVTTYRHPDTDQLVSLVGVVHIGDPGYFRRIQQELDAHDLVLYELVGGPAPGSPEDDGRLSAESDGDTDPMLGMIGMMQSGMTEMLGLSHQMNGINYTRRNLRHADLDFEGFSAGLAERGLFNLDPLLILQGMGSSTFDGLAIQAALASRDDQTTNRLRWAMGKTMAQSVGEMAFLGVEDIEKPEDLILGLRNDRAWEIFENSLKENWRRTAIFYGAAHMPDLRRRLLETGWIPEDIFWLGAWKIPVPAEDSPTEPESAVEVRL
jgi:hypothetical protein